MRGYCVLKNIFVASAALLAALLGPALGYKGFYLSHVFVALFIMSGLIAALTGSGRSPKLGAVLACASILLYAVASSALFANTGAGYAHVEMLLASFGTLALAFGVTRNELEVDDVRRVIVVFCVMLVAISVAEYFWGWRLPVSRYSTFHTANNGAPVGDPLYNVPTGFYGNQNNLALIALVVLPLTWGLPRGLLALAVRTALIVIILITDSRDAIVCLIAILALAWLLQLKGRDMVASLAVALVALGVLFGAQRHLVDNLCGQATISKFCVVGDLIEDGIDLETLAERTDSLGVRASLTMQAWELFEANPIWGVGPGTLTERISATHFEAGEIVNLHNPALEILAEYGVMGALPWIALWGMLIVSSLRIRHARLRAACIATTLVLPIACMSVSGIYYFTALWALLGMFVGVAHHFSVAEAEQ